MRYLDPLKIQKLNHREALAMGTEISGDYAYFLHEAEVRVLVYEDYRLKCWRADMHILRTAGMPYFAPRYKIGMKTENDALNLVLLMARTFPIRWDHVHPWSERCGFHVG